MSSKRTLNDFFTSPKAKKAKTSPPPASIKQETHDETQSPITPPRIRADTTPITKQDGIKQENNDDNNSSSQPLPPSTHPTYPFPIPLFPISIQSTLSSQTPAREGKKINHLPDLDLLYFEPFIPRSIENEIFQFLRTELPFYRVKYKINRGSFSTDINTPRFTTVFGLDSTSVFSAPSTSTSTTNNSSSNSSSSNSSYILDALTKLPVPAAKYAKCITPPRPLPGCLDQLRQLTEIFTGCEFNICLVNYYADGNDSISYHSDDERFLGPEPAIASFSFGAKRDFLLKHKPVASGSDSSVIPGDEDMKPLKFPLASGDMILMRGRTQANWLHSIPKRKGGESGKGRINITFRKAVVPGGTANYYQYNVGQGPVYRWDKKAREMREVDAGGQNK